MNTINRNVSFPKKEKCYFCKRSKKDLLLNAAFLGVLDLVLSSSFVYAADEERGDDIVFDATVAENYSESDKSSISGALSTGLFFVQSGNKQEVTLENISELTASGLSTSTGSSSRGLFTARTIASNPSPSTQIIKISSDTINSSNGNVFVAIGFEGSKPRGKQTEQYIHLNVDTINSGKGTLISGSTGNQQGFSSTGAFLAFDAKQHITGKVEKITTDQAARGIGLLLYNSANSTAQDAEQYFEGEIGQIGSEDKPFNIGVRAYRGGDQVIDKIGSIYGTFAGIDSTLNDVGNAKQIIKSVDRVIAYNTQKRPSWFAYGIRNWSDVGNWDYVGSQSIGVTESISAYSGLGQAIAIYNQGGRQEIRSLSEFNEENGNLGVTVSSEAAQLPIGLRVRPLLYDNKHYTETVTILEGPFHFVDSSLQVMAPVDATTAKPRPDYGNAELWLKPNNYGAVLTLAAQQGIVVQAGNNITSENTIANTRLRLGNEGVPYTVRMGADTYISDAGMFSGTGVIQFDAAYLSDKHVFAENKPNVGGSDGELPEPSEPEEPDQPSQPEEPDQPTQPEEPNPEVTTATFNNVLTDAELQAKIKTRTSGYLNLSINYSALSDQTETDSKDEGSEENPPEITNPPEEQEPEKRPYDEYKYPYGINGPYSSYWAVGGKTGQAPYIYLNKIDTVDGKPIAADRSNASTLDLVVKAYVYEGGKNTGVLINSDNLCSGGKCEGEEHIPGWPGARDDAKLANAFWLLRSAANSVFANEGIENLGSQADILIKDDYKDGYFGLSKGTMWHKLTDEEGNEILDENGNPVIRRWDPKDPNAQFAKAAGWVYLPEGVVNNAYKAQWYFENTELVGETATDLNEYAAGLPKNVKYRGEIIDLATWFPQYPLEPGFTHPLPLFPATPIPKPNPQPTPTMKSIEAVSLSHYFTWRQEIDTLHQRLGEVRDNYELEGLWARGYAGRNRINSNGYYFRDNYKGIQIGLDRNYYEYKDSYRCREKDGENFPCKREKKHDWTYGTGLSYTEGDLKLSRGGNADNWMASWWLYGVRKFSNGGYLDLVGKVSRFSNEFSAWSSDYLLNTKGRDKTWGYTLSAEYGNKHYLFENKDWYLDPQLQIVYGRIFGSSFRTNNDVNVHHNAVNSLIGRAGVALGYEGKKGSAFVKVDGLREFKGKLVTTYKLDDGSFNASRFNLKETWGEVSAGGTYTFSRKKDKLAHFYVKRSFASKLKTDYRVDIGFEYIF
ncbi:autotransporter outer membrane beta-barrel domain-containing protein [uncultured Parasutterella sp.]|uniref:autotransporter outer membrane beta-barrel domain-containing protein n=1 Tax=uncultured Parasutterella sp. TaxID=1263098 RepID=UPI0034A1A72A